MNKVDCKDDIEGAIKGVHINIGTLYLNLIIRFCGSAWENFVFYIFDGTEWNE